jgi:hypothetical protein
MFIVIALFAAGCLKVEQCPSLLPVAGERVSLVTTPAGKSGCKCVTDDVTVVVQAERSGLSGWKRGQIWVDGAPVSDSKFQNALMEAKTRHAAKGIEFLTKELDFVFSLYQAAELEVRSTERWLLVALAALYSYLATKAARDITARFPRLAWWTPVALVTFAGIRAIALGLRQHYVMIWLQTAETTILPPDFGWASFSESKPWIVSITVAVFYGALVLATTVIAISRSSDKEAKK